ncbi:hypothetical protein PsYK624_166200 [Phanerochaete sordida]|uniref:Uncharacterized protein n=1 Tax=Phanerochaete sordida TaxID=48140 RepID=A0A9P3GTF0_9APHY|nr:hypothetical protein PsYK624_166200 [Phanerochaete sordida]
MSTPTKPPAWIEHLSGPSHGRSSPPRSPSPRSHPNPWPAGWKPSTRKCSTLSITSLPSVSSGTSDYMASLLYNCDDDGRTNSCDDPSPSCDATPRAERDPGAPLIDHTGEKGYVEPDTPEEVYIAAQPATADAGPDPLWVLVWETGNVVRVVRSRHGLPASNVRLARAAPRGAAFVYMTHTREIVAGTKDLRHIHMERFSVGRLAPEQRAQLIETALGTAVWPCSHREWVENVVDKACERGILDASAVAAAGAQMQKCQAYL